MVTNLLYKRMERGSLFHVVCYLALAFIGMSSIGSIAKARHWHIGNTMNVYIENARLISEAEKPLLITDFVNNRSLADFMIATRDCSSDSIYILRASPGIDSVENRINQREYSDTYVLYASDELVENLKSQSGSKMEKLDVKGISSMWRIPVEKQ